jgi:hypothetical protein
MEDKKTYEPLSDIENVLPILNKISILAGLSDPQLYTIFRLLSQVSYKANETVFEQGEEPGHIYIVKNGKVKLVVWEDDTPLELIEFEQGHCFGEASVIGIQPHKGTAIAVIDRGCEINCVNGHRNVNLFIERYLLWPNRHRRKHVSRNSLTNCSRIMTVPNRFGVNRVYLLI